MDNHQKHAKLAKPSLGEFHRNELAILGTNCANIRKLSNQIIQELYAKYQVAFVDADHQAAQADENSVLAHGAALEFTDKVSHRVFAYKQKFNAFQNRTLFNEQDLVLVNGNHFAAQSQIVVIDPVKPLDKKLEKLTNVQLILLTDGVSSIPDYLTNHLPAGAAVPILKMADVLALTTFIDKYLLSRLPVLNGLVLAGGQSQRMQTDKGSIQYFGKSQRLHMYEMMSALCTETFVSYASQQWVNQQEQLPVVLDSFTGLGPFGGILSAFQQNPNAAWLTVACDLPYLTAQTLNHLMENRNPSKIATCFMDSENQFPEPLITIWEPRAYPVMLQFLSQGYSCPRKVLINSDVELLQAPAVEELQNVNYPAQRQEAMARLQQGGL
ncbi:NTP transferase domain-containing protein [Mucilaginibacter sp. PAMB04168]|uniref:NTP transferase domain-containing protein n=1 Tax=Mucilaginibacter sp. PAMB04168 TaxID=3138567 RepID=UPI0031F70403